MFLLSQSQQKIVSVQSSIKIPGLIWSFIEHMFPSLSRPFWIVSININMSSRKPESGRWHAQSINRKLEFPYISLGLFRFLSSSPASENLFRKMRFLFWVSPCQQPPSLAPIIVLPLFLKKEHRFYIEISWATWLGIFNWTRTHTHTQKNKNIRHLKSWANSCGVQGKPKTKMN